MDLKFSIQFAVNCIILALLNAVVIVSIYLVANQKFGEVDIVVRSYLNGCMIALGFYFMFFFLPNYRAHIRLSKFEGGNYIASLKQELLEKNYMK